MKIEVWVCAWLTFAAGARAAIIDTSMVIDAEHSFPAEPIEVVDGLNPPTVVDLVPGGTVGVDVQPSIVARGQSQINLMGGQIGQRNEGIVQLYDSSKLNVKQRYDDAYLELHDTTSLLVTESHSMGYVSARGSSRARFVGADLQRATAYDNAIVQLTDVHGMFSYIDVSSHGQSEIRIHNGHDLDFVSAKDDSTIWLDGHSHYLDVYDRANVHFYGGRVTNNIGVRDDATLHIYGYDLELTFGDDEFDTWVQGLDRQHRPFGTPYRLLDNGRIVLHELPEPSTIALGGIAFVALACARRLSAKH